MTGCNDALGTDDPCNAQCSCHAAADAEQDAEKDAEEDGVSHRAVPLSSASLLGRLARSGTDWTPDTALLEATRREAAMLLQQQP